MSSCDRRWVCGGLVIAVVTGCGFKPLYRQGDGAAELLGKISLQEAKDPENYAVRERLRRRLGDGGTNAPYALIWDVQFEEIDVAITPTADITRYQVNAILQYQLIDRDTDKLVDSGSARTSGAYDATADAFPSRQSAQDERQRISIELAELTATRLLASANLE